MADKKTETAAKLPLTSKHANAAHALKTIRYGKNGQVSSCYSVKVGTKNAKTTQIGVEANEAVNAGACTTCGFDAETHELGETLAAREADTFTPAAHGPGGTWS